MKVIFSLSLIIVYRKHERQVKSKPQSQLYSSLVANVKEAISVILIHHMIIGQSCIYLLCFSSKFVGALAMQENQYFVVNVAL